MAANYTKSDARVCGIEHGDGVPVWALSDRGRQTLFCRSCLCLHIDIQRDTPDGARDSLS
jgi:hypothetical protein